MIRQVLTRTDFWEFPPRHITMNAIHERRIISHFLWQWREQMSDSLLLRYVHIEITDHHDTPECPDAFLAAREFPGGHVAFHDVRPVLLVERNARHFVEA